MTSINFAKLLADERKKARLARANTPNVEKPEKNTPPMLSLSRIINASDEIEIGKYKVGSIPNVYYIPQFVTKEESDIILKNVYSHQNKWTKLKRRRLQNWGGIPSIRGMLPETLPPFLTEVCTHMARCKVFQTPPNHILLNEYNPGQGIMSHKDGPLYFPRVAILSLGGPAVIEFRKELSLPPVLSLYLHPRSLLIFQDEAYTDYFHGIAEVERDEITSAMANLKFSESPSSSFSSSSSHLPSSTSSSSPSSFSSSSYAPSTSTSTEYGTPVSATENTEKEKETTKEKEETREKETEEEEPRVEIGQVVERKDTRVSLTIRTVLKVLNEDKSPATQAEEEELRRIEKHWYNAINEVV